MNLNCNLSLGDRYARNAQRARVITEAWFAAEGYCLHCDSNELEQTTPGTIARDFICIRCNQPYELKAASKTHTSVVQDGGFNAMMRRIQAEEAPALMLMNYSPEWRVRKLVAIHPVFLTPTVVRKRRKPHIRPGTGQQYWMCDLNLNVIPADGKIVLVDGIARPQRDVRKEFRESMRFAEIPLDKRGWTALVLAFVRKIGKEEFSLTDVYAHEERMHAVYPENSHVRDKIRQQLQVLRDLGYIEFLTKRGEYRMLL